MPRRQLVLLVFACLWLILLVAPAPGQRGPNVMELRQAVQKNPQDPEANYKLGMKYMELGRSRQANKYLQEAIRLKPDYPEALEAMAKLNSGQGNYGAAAQDLNKVIKLKPNDTELRDRMSNDYNRQGLALLKEGRFKDAEAAFKEASKGDPKATGPLNNLGVAYSQAGKRDDAIQAFKEALSRDPDNAEAHFNLGFTFWASGNMRAAYAESLNLRRLNPKLAHQLDALSSPPRTPQSGPYLDNKKYYRVYQP